MPYRLILLVGCIVLTATVALATVASMFFPDSLKWYIAGIVLQLVLSLFVILRFKIAGPQIRP